MTNPRIAPAYALAHAGRLDVSALETIVLAAKWRAWARPDQIFPSHDWRSLGFIAGRGWGKTLAIAAGINERVERGEIKALGLMGPDADRVDEIQISALIETSPPWFKAKREGGTVVWPNGVKADVFTAESPEKPRSANLDFAWLLEIVAWPEATRTRAFLNITTATRVGRAQFVWDTTSQGKNELILALEEAHRNDPDANLIQRGTTFDNPLLGRKYLRDVCSKYKGRRRQEELEGLVFAEADGALWSQATIDDNRVTARPARRAQTIFAVDPALSVTDSSDETGLVLGDLGADGHAYLVEDASDKLAPEAWAKVCVDWCVAGAAGGVVERNAGGDMVIATIRAAATASGLRVEVLPVGDADKPFPRRVPGTIFIRQTWSRSSKGERGAAPAVEGAAGRVHVVGEMAALELEMTTYVPGTKSPNRFDAANEVITELAGLAREKASDRTAAAHDAAAANKALAARLVAAARGRTVGI